MKTVCFVNTRTCVFSQWESDPVLLVVWTNRHLQEKTWYFRLFLRNWFSGDKNILRRNVWICAFNEHVFAERKSLVVRRSSKSLLRKVFLLRLKNQACKSDSYSRSVGMTITNFAFVFVSKWFFLLQRRRRWCLVLDRISNRHQPNAAVSVGMGWRPLGRLRRQCFQRGFTDEGHRGRVLPGVKLPTNVSALVLLASGRLRAEVDIHQEEAARWVPNGAVGIIVWRWFTVRRNNRCPCPFYPWVAHDQRQWMNSLYSNTVRPKYTVGNTFGSDKICS